MPKKLYVGNLAYAVTDQNLNELFSGIGAVASAAVISDKFSGQSKGFGFVEMSDDKQAAQAIKIGHGMQPDTEMGPLVSSEQFERVTGYLKIGADEGARTITGGHAIDGPGFFVQPTVLVDATSDQRIIQEEIFGPVVAAMPFADVMPSALTASIIAARPSARCCACALSAETAAAFPSLRR